MMTKVFAGAGLVAIFSWLLPLGATQACSPPPPSMPGEPAASAPPSPPPKAEDVALSLYKSDADYVIVGKLGNFRDMPVRAGEVGRRYTSDVKVVETIRGAGPFHASRLTFRYHMTSCDFMQPPQGVPLIIGVDRHDPLPGGVWWFLPTGGVIEELERLGKTRAGA